MKYDGIFPETLALMAQNRFENSKAFYEEHKQELKDGFTVPLRQIAMALGGKVFELPVLQNNFEEKGEIE